MDNELTKLRIDLEIRDGVALEVVSEFRDKDILLVILRVPKKSIYHAIRYIKKQGKWFGSYDRSNVSFIEICEYVHLIKDNFK